MPKKPFKRRSPHSKKNRRRLLMKASERFIVKEPYTKPYIKPKEEDKKDKEEDRDD